MLQVISAPGLLEPEGIGGQLVDNAACRSWRQTFLEMTPGFWGSRQMSKAAQAAHSQNSQDMTHAQLPGPLKLLTFQLSQYSHKQRLTAARLAGSCAAKSQPTSCCMPHNAHEFSVDDQSQ